MKLCSDDHEEVCYEGRECPACKAKEDLGDVISRLTQRYEELEEEAVALKKYIQELEACPLRRTAVQEAEVAS
jgi:hypothetical protein